MEKIAIVLSCPEGRIIAAMVLILAAMLGALVCALSESFYYREDVFIDDCN